MRTLAQIAFTAILVLACSESFDGHEQTVAPSPSITTLEGAVPSALRPIGRPGGSPGASFIAPEARIDGQLFGMAGHLMWRGLEEADLQLDMLAEDGLDVIRFDVSWRETETSPGRYLFLEKLDHIVDGAEARGLQLIISVLETPGWANGGCCLWDPPEDPADYANFVGMLASRYAGRILGWEIWNEPDLDIFWRGRPRARTYTKLLVASSRAIREADPSANVVASGPTFGNLAFLESMYDAGAHGAFDALAVHPYTLRYGPDDRSNRFYSLPLILDDIRAVLERRGDGNRPVWITEVGWSLIGGTAVTPRQRDEYTRRMVAMVRERPWIRVLTLYATDVADSDLRGLSEGGVRSSTWLAYVEAVTSP